PPGRSGSSPRGQPLPSPRWRVASGRRRGAPPPRCRAPPPRCRAPQLDLVLQGALVVRSFPAVAAVVVHVQLEPVRQLVAPGGVGRAAPQVLPDLGAAQVLVERLPAGLLATAVLADAVEPDREPPPVLAGVTAAAGSWHRSGSLGEQSLQRLRV